MAFAKALLEGIVQFLAGQAFFALFEVMAHDVFIDLDHLIDDPLVGIGNVREVRFAARSAETIDDCRTTLRWQVDRQAFVAEGVAQLLDQHFEVVVLVVHLVDDQQAAQPPRLGVLHHPRRRIFDAVVGIDDDRAGFDGGQRRQRLAAEIRISRRVDQVDVHAGVIDRGNRRADRMLALAFHRVVVRHRVAAFDGSLRVDRAAGKKQGFKQ